MRDTITASLQVASLAASALAKLSPLMHEFPQLEGVVDHCTYLMNETLDQVADELASLFPETPRASVNGHRVNGRGHPAFTGIPLADGSPAAPEPAGGLDPLEDEELPWDPSSGRETGRCKALLLEVLRRAAHDWVLYRQHRKMDKRELAHDAYIWLFEEDERHPHWRERVGSVFPGRRGKPAIRGARTITSFLAICEHLDLDPDTVRSSIKKMDARSIIASGRPPQQRYPVKESEDVVECSVPMPLEQDDGPDSENYVSQYESIGAVPTPTIVYLGLKEPRDRAPSPEGDWF